MNNTQKNMFLSLLPTRCLFCYGYVGGGIMCTLCQSQLPTFGDTQIVQYFSLSKRCIVPHLAVWSMWPYQWPLSALQHKCKFSGWKLGGEMFAELAAHTLAQHNNSAWHGYVLVPTPMHWQRKLRRGFNHTIVQGEVIAKYLRIPCCRSWLVRIRSTPRQVGLDRVQRMRNVQNVFLAKPDVAGKKIVLFDDIVTTGATMCTMAETLYNAGARDVIGLSLLRVDVR